MAAKTAGTAFAQGAHQENHKQNDYDGTRNQNRNAEPRALVDRDVLFDCDRRHQIDGCEFLAVVGQRHGTELLPLRNRRRHIGRQGNARFDLLCGPFRQQRGISLCRNNGKGLVSVARFQHRQRTDLLVCRKDFLLLQGGKRPSIQLACVGKRPVILYRDAVAHTRRPHGHAQ